MLAGLKILIIDDDADTRELFTFTLQEEGAEVVAAASAREALAVIDRSQFDVVVSDIQMPEEDGFFLIQQIQTSKPMMPMIAVTAFAREEDRRKILAAGFHQYLVKPVDLDDLLNKIATCAKLASYRRVAPILSLSFNST